MKTLQQNNSMVGSTACWGERGHWFIAAAQTRDSDCLERSNFRSFKQALNELQAVKDWQGEFTPVAVESFSHWAVGWCEYLLIDPECTEAVKLAEELRESLEDYPVLDEHDFSQLEQDEASETWRNCYREKERIKYIREHRSQFEFQSFADLLGCVRGKYFAGYASELLS